MSEGHGDPKDDEEESEGSGSGTESGSENGETSSSPTRSQEIPHHHPQQSPNNQHDPEQSQPNQEQSPGSKANNGAGDGDDLGNDLRSEGTSPAGPPPEISELATSSPSPGVRNGDEEIVETKETTGGPPIIQSSLGSDETPPEGDENLTDEVKAPKERVKGSEKFESPTDGNKSPSVRSSPSPSENIRISPSLIGRDGRRSNLSNEGRRERLSVTVPGSPFESGANTECIQLLRQLWSVHEEATQFLERIRRALCHFRRELRSQENEFESSFREKRLSTVNFGGSLSSKKTFGGGSGDLPGGPSGSSGDEERKEPWVSLQIFIDGLKCILDYFSDIDKQYLILCVFQSQCKLALFAKVKHAKQQVAHDRLSIMHGVQELISVVLHLISTPEFWSHSEEDRTTLMVQNVFQLTEIYNWYLESSSAIPSEATLTTSSTSSTSLKSPEGDKSLVPPTTPKADTAPLPSSPIDDPKKTPNLPNKLRILVQIRAANRNNSPLLRLSLKPLSATRLLQILAQKRSTFAAHAFTRVTLSSFYSDPKGVLSVDKFEPCFTDEDSRLSPLGKGFSQCPSLLGRAAVKKTENGDQRLSRSARTKMYSYFHEVLWTLAGEHSEDLLLWGLHSNVIPLVLQPLDLFISLRNALMLGQHFQESHLSPMLSAFDSVGGALHSFTLLANWDEKMREAFGETHKVKRPEQVILVSKPEPSDWATEIGSKFGQIVLSCISLIDSGGNLPNIMRSTALRLSENEEEPLGDEAQTLFRLEATLVYFKAWVVKRSKVWLNGWAIPQFLACSQRESALLVQLIKSREPVLITRDLLLNNPNVSIRLSAKHRQMCAEDLRAALHQLQSMPEELLQAVGPICSTLSLATLQSYMPPASHWKGMGQGSARNPDKPSSYVHIFIERIIEPVMRASVELVPGPVQEAMGKQVVHAACDAWLQYILQKKIRFSEWGAVQLLRDFTAFREWIRVDTELEKEARKSILQLEVLKRCEGVAYLLLRNPGDILGVGKKPTRKNRRVAPTSSDSVESSPSGGESSIAEDDSIPPEMYVPNQQMWLELRLRRGLFNSPCCS